jgi:hypothetical protein
MPRVGFEPKILTFEREKTDYALDGVATVIVHFLCITSKYSKCKRLC